MPFSVKMVANERSEGVAIPLHEVYFLEFTDQAVALSKTGLHGIFLSDAWLQRSQITRHQDESSDTPTHKQNDPSGSTQI